jgi:hypothetical protein
MTAPIDEPRNSVRPEQLHAAVEMITDLQRFCRELRAAINELGEACRQIEALDPGCTNPRNLRQSGESVPSGLFQHRPLFAAVAGECSDGQ